MGYDGLATPFNFRLRGQVIYPATLAGPTPLVVIAHGNHYPKMVDVGMGFTPVDANVTSDENYKGYTYLQTHLASRGFITLSVDLDEAFGVPGYGYPTIALSGIKIRAWLTLKNIERLISDATIAGGALVGKIDTSRIYLIGHSRGGEAVVVAYHLLKTPADAPGGASPVGFTAAGVKGIVSISPVTAAIEAGGIAPQDIPYLMLYGSADGDVNGATPGAEPFRHYDRATNNKYAVRIMGANHNFFNQSWPASDASQTVAGSLFAATINPLVPPVGANLTTRPQQEGLAKGYIAAFLNLVDGGDDAARNFFLEQPSHLIPLGVDPALALVMHSQARLAGVPKRVVDDYETNPAVTLSSSGQAVTTTVPLANISENLLLDPGVQVADETEAFNRFFQETRGVLMGWSAAAEYVETLAGPDQDLRGAHTISFRVAQQPKAAQTVALAGPLTLSVELEDAGAKTSSVSLGAIDTVPEIYVAQVDLKGMVGLRETTSAGFKTFRIPVSAFTTDGRDIDLSAITKIRFKLAAPGDSTQGRVAIDDIEVER
jgi:dienelactone hydrolase